MVKKVFPKCLIPISISVNFKETKGKTFRCDRVWILQQDPQFMLMWNSRTVVAFRFRCHMVWLAQPIYNSSKERRESKWSCFIANTLQGKVYQLFVHAEWKQITFSFKTFFFNNKLEIHFHICIPFIQDIGLNFLRKNLHCFQGIFCKKEEIFWENARCTAFFSKDEQNREWNPCEILFQLKWSCHRVFCSQREMLLLLLTLISWTNFLSLGIKIWARHAKKLLFPIFHWAAWLANKSFVYAWTKCQEDKAKIYELFAKTIIFRL